jgi:hypothetical protein
MDAGKKISLTTQIHEIYIKAAPELIWDALTTPRVDREICARRCGRVRTQARRQIPLAGHAADALHGLAGSHHRRRGDRSQAA